MPFYFDKKNTLYIEVSCLVKLKIKDKNIMLPKLHLGLYYITRKIIELRGLFVID